MHSMMPIARALPAVLLCASFAPAQTDNWLTGPGGSSARNCLSSRVGPDKPTLIWQGGISAIVSQQAVIEGDLMVVARITNFDIPTGTTIAAHDLHTGKILWTTQLPFNNAAEWRSRVSAIRNDVVYASRSGNTISAPMYALDAADGKIIWESQDTVDESTTEGLAFTDDGDLIIGSFSHVRRISAADGSTMWTTTRACPTTDGCMASVFGDHFYYWEASGDGPMVAVGDVETGELLYSSEGIGGGFIQQLGLLVGPDGTVYGPRTQNNAITDFFVALEDTGDDLIEKWSVPLGYTPFATMGVGPDGSVYSYLTDNDNGLFNVIRLDPETGAELNASDDLVGGFPLQPRMAIDADGKVFVTNGQFANGRLFVLTADLEVIWETAITNVNLGGPALGQDGVLIVCGTGADVRAYQTKIQGPVGDLDGDGVVGTADLIILLGMWGRCDNCRECIADLDGDCTVGTGDLITLLGNWG